MYPSWLVSSMLYVSIDMVKGFMHSEPNGAFCFVKAYKRAMDSTGKPVTKEFALHHAGGNQYLADLMLKSEDKATVMIVAKDSSGSVKTFQTPTSNLSRFASLDAFISDFSQATGIPVSQDKFIDPAAGYRAAF